eukprot:NODE_1861_length_877_cov_303.349034_g1296_i0.p2 GENE.NODE_1861_length_877_cov_303.349034_g1296_i0~~NODE_1861_length_877_cov_303.349034_g1296_i0.p2  ORF type:complete len:112 (-),score=25.75 NODE_1861_length_877_cov_303.349034_g1296_i0:4-339(-)
MSIRSGVSVPWRYMHVQTCLFCFSFFFCLLFNTRHACMPAIRLALRDFFFSFTSINCLSKTSKIFFYIRLVSDKKCDDGIPWRWRWRWPLLLRVDLPFKKKKKKKKKKTLR